MYASVQQFNKDFIREWFGTTRGARWKVPGSPHGRAGLNYLGDNPAPYKRLYDIKSKDDPEVWADVVQFCKVLNQTPSNHLEAALAPWLDIEGTLKFLALENALINNDGYWVRASAEKWLDWNRLGPVVAQYRAVIAEDVKTDTRKLYSTEAFFQGVADDPPAAGAARFGRGQPMSLRAFADRRRAYLLSGTRER
ncbi:MAG: CotH kinase family protein [Verrucomicrobia bacterium]|nr:CotH kinase family protein [Verrucomicrobiota bacterium]